VVVFEVGSKLRLIEADAFDHRPTCLQPVDVPSRAKIQGFFKVLREIRAQDGSKYRRVRFGDIVPRPDMIFLGNLALGHVSQPAMNGMWDWQRRALCVVI
jgi:hypothetical protein